MKRRCSGTHNVPRQILLQSTTIRLHDLPHAIAPWPPSSHATRSLLLGLEVVEKDRTLLRLLTPVAHNHAGAVDHLPRISLTIENT